MTYAIKTNSCRKDGRLNRTFRYIFINKSIDKSINHPTNQRKLTVANPLAVLLSPLAGDDVLLLEAHTGNQLVEQLTNPSFSYIQIFIIVYFVLSVGKLTVFHRFLEILAKNIALLIKNCGEKKISKSVSGYFNGKKFL